jgi:hypothetical protein
MATIDYNQCKVNHLFYVLMRVFMPTQQAARDALQKLITRYHAIPLTDQLALTESDILEKFVVPLAFVNFDTEVASILFNAAL